MIQIRYLQNIYFFFNGLHHKLFLQPVLTMHIFCLQTPTEQPETTGGMKVKPTDHTETAPFKEPRKPGETLPMY